MLMHLQAVSLLGGARGQLDWRARVCNRSRQERPLLRYSSAAIRLPETPMAASVCARRLTGTGGGGDDAVGLAGGVFGPGSSTRDICDRGLAARAAIERVCVEGCDATVVSCGPGSSELVFGPDFGGFYDEPDPDGVSVGLFQRLLRGVFARQVGTAPVVSAAGADLPEGGRSIELGFARVADAPIPESTHAYPASADEAIEVLADWYSTAATIEGHTLVTIRVLHRPVGCFHTVEGTLRIVVVDESSVDQHLQQLEASLCRVTGHAGYPSREDPLSLLLDGVMSGASTCHAVVTLQEDADSPLLRVGRYLQLLSPQSGRPNVLKVASHSLTKVLRQQQRENTLKQELARREIKAARSGRHAGAWDHLAGGADGGGPSMPLGQLSDELARVVGGLPDTMGSLRALCALVPQAKAVFAQMGGIGTLTNLIDFKKHGGNVSYNSVYSIAALCDDNDAAQESLRKLTAICHCL